MTKAWEISHFRNAREIGTDTNERDSREDLGAEREIRLHEDKEKGHFWEDGTSNTTEMPSRLRLETRPRIEAISGSLLV